ncbi:hypothetical protein ACQQ4G_003112 [Listeria monocytogenes]
MSKSIISNKRECLICKTSFNLHKHHIFGGFGKRDLSEEYGCWCYLCARHHDMSDEGAHFDKILDTKLKKHAQKKFTEHYKNLDFRKIFGKNYL